VIEGMVPSLADLPVGCRFQNRCPFRTDACAIQPALDTVAGEHRVACHRWREFPPAPEPAMSEVSTPTPLLEVRDLRMHFPARGGLFLRTTDSCKAVDGVNLTVYQAKPSASSANPAAANPLSGNASCASTGQPAGALDSKATTSRA
jgi:hypothetical protein